MGTLPQVLTGIACKSSQLKSWQITNLRVSFAVCRGHSVVHRSEFDPDNIDIRDTMRETFTAHTHFYFVVLLSVEASCVHVCIVSSLPPIVKRNGYTQELDTVIWCVFMKFKLLRRFTLLVFLRKNMLQHPL